MSVGLTDPAQLLEQAGLWLDALRDRGLVAEAAEANLREMLIRSRAERLDAPGDPLLVAMLCGPTAVGKSSLINALAGAEISRPGLGAATSAAVLYVHDRDDPARLFEYSEALGQLGRESASLVRHTRDELLHKILVDTPDIDSVLQRHREITGALVYCADLVLFVTSPEKYKDMHSARWVEEQRRQRAIACVLNKWDRSAFGPQYGQRHVVERDFRSLLLAEGFRDPVIFKVSALAAPRVGDRESELEALRSWLGEGLDRSAAAAIQDRRRRAAWGQLGAAVSLAVPGPLSDQPLTNAAAKLLGDTRAQAHRLVKSEALALTPSDGLADSVRFVTPGLLGSWMRTKGVVGAMGSPVRALVAWLGALGRLRQFAAPAPGGEASTSARGEYGRAASILLARTTAGLARDAEAARLPLGPVGAAWAMEANRLGQQLASLPAEVEGDLTAEAHRHSLRRSAGAASLYTIEALLSLVLLITLWRLGSGFVLGNYMPGALLLNALALIVALLFVGGLVAKFFFPEPKERLRRVVSRRAEGLIDAAWRHAQTALKEQLDAAARLTREGRELLEAIDGVIGSLIRHLETDASGVQRLFGEGMPQVTGREPVRMTAGNDPVLPMSRRRPPKFD